MRGENPKQYRVLNLIRKVNLETASPKKRMIIKLLEWQPLAERIQFETDSHCKGAYFLSYQLPIMDNRRRHADMEECGFYCPCCGWGNAGLRPIKSAKLKPKTEVD